jgi:hypothetical protein
MAMNNTIRYPGSDSGFVVFSLDNHQYYSLDALAARVWSLIQQPRTLHEIIEDIRDCFDVDAETAEHELLALLQAMEDAGLVEAEKSA